MAETPQITSLADSLSQWRTDQHTAGSFRCVVARIVADLDDDDQTTLVDMLTSDMSTRAITEICARAGVRFAESSLHKHRRGVCSCRSETS